MISEDYISFETAKLLKEKGFDVETEHKMWYVVKQFSTGCHWNLCTYKEGDKTREYNEECCIAMPTLQMAMKWLKEVHNIYIAVNLTYSEEPKLFPPEYYVYINDTLTGESLIKDVCSLVQDKTLTPKGFKRSETACEVAIKYCLENLI